MATDGLSLAATIYELQALVGARIDKVQQPDKDLLLLHLHGASCGRVKLLLCIHAENGRLQLTPHTYENPVSAPAFCMLLRKHLIGCAVTELYQMGLDRVAVFSLKGKDALQDEAQWKLVVELMGKHGNVFLLDGEGRIQDCMRHFGVSEDAARICLPNILYENPPAEQKLHPFFSTHDELCAAAKGRAPAQWMCGALDGVSKLCARQIVRDDTPYAEGISAMLNTFLQLSLHLYAPNVLPNQGVLPFAPQNGVGLPFATMSEAQDAFYRMRDAQSLLTKQRTALRTVLEHAKKRVAKKLELCVQQIGDETSLERDRLYGELLTVQRDVPKGGRAEATLLNYYADPPAPVTVPLDPRYSVQENAQRYFKRYRKGKAARAYALEQQGSLADELSYLEGLLLDVEACTTGDELREIADELTAAHYLRPTQGKAQKPQHKASVPLLYEAADGTRIFVGKNNLQNERLIRSADAQYVWLHAKDVPASHVVIASASPSRETLALAARIAAVHSKAAASAQVPVDYTRICDVKKPSGAKPGFVNYFHQHTLFVTPSLEAIAPYRKDTP